jgi:type I restriction enzyme S subunit
MSFPRYPAYKDSGVEWLGFTPSHWSTAPIKRQFQVVGGSTPKSDAPEFWDGSVPWVTPADLSRLTGFEISSSLRTITEAGLQSCGTTMVPPGSVVLSTRAPIGSLGISAIELCTNQGCKALVPRAEQPTRFLAYLLSVNAAELNIRGRGTTFLELSADELGAFRVPVPPPTEQTAIATFLDHETAKIDALVAEQERLIELLKEKRQAVISHAVTKGLDPSAPMKDSGVEWLGVCAAEGG